MGRLLIIDGHAYAYRAFYAIRELRSPAGRPTNAIFGFAKMLEKMLAGLRPESVVVVWDGGLSVERLALLPDYKAQRPETPPDLKIQLDDILVYLQAAGVVSLCRDGVEADDLIASLAKAGSGVSGGLGAERERSGQTGLSASPWPAGVSVVIASADKDFMQLVSERVGLFNPNDKSEAVWTAAQVRAKTGVEPEQVVDWLSLMGDSVDNIPGVPGVGPKTAADLLGQFGTADALLARLAEVKSERLRTVLAGSVELVRRNREMVRLRDDLPCDFSPAEFRLRPSAVEPLRQLYRQWGFKGLLAALDAPNPDRQPVLI